MVTLERNRVSMRLEAMAKLLASHPEPEMQGFVDDLAAAALFLKSDMEERKQGRQEGFAEAREMAAVLSQSWRNGGYHIRDLPRHIRALQPPRDEGKREDGDG